MITEQNQQNCRYPNLMAFILYLFSSITMTWPVLPRLFTEYAGGRSDQLVHQWTFWWVKQALLNGQTPFYTKMLYFPDGAPLLSHNIAWLNIAFWLPMQAVIGEMAAYNVMFILIYTLNGWAMYLLAKTLNLPVMAAFTAGLIFGFWPYTLSHYDHPNMSLLFAIPLAMLFLYRTIKQQRWRYAVGSGLFIALIGISRWQHLLMSVPLISLFIIYQIITTPKAKSWQMIKLLAAAGGVAFLLMLPLAASLILSQLQPNAQEILILETGHTDLLAYFISPQLYNRLYGEAYHHIAASIDYIPYLGYSTLLLAAIGIGKRWRQTRFWLGVALLYMLLAFGINLTINGQSFPQFFMPYRLLDDTFIGDFIRRPHRLNVILGLPMGMIAGWGTAVILDWLTKRTQRQTAVFIPFALIPLLILAETHNVIPYTTTPFNIPPWYHQLAEDSDNFGLLELPIHDRAYDKWYMAYQTYHHKPIMSGHISRMPDEAWLALEKIPWLINAHPNKNYADFSYTAVGQQMLQLTQNNIRYVILHKQLFDSPGMTDIWRDWMTYSPIYEDEETIVYSTDLQSGRDFVIETPLTDSIGLLHSRVTPLATISGGLLKIDARWGSTAVPDEDMLVCTGLKSEAWESNKMECEPIMVAYPTDTWLANDVIRGSHQYSIPSGTPPGSYDLIIGLVNADTGIVTGKTAVLDTITVQPFSPAHQTEADWEDSIHLMGYDLQQSIDMLELDFYWRIDQKTDHSYKIFVHLIDSATGQPIVQHDAIPRAWTYPTNIWEAGEIVEDSIALPLQDVPPGQYELWVGLYDEISGERLPATATGGLPEREDAVLLTQVTQ